MDVVKVVVMMTTLRYSNNTFDLDHVENVFMVVMRLNEQILHGGYGLSGDFLIKFGPLLVPFFSESPLA